MTCSKCGLPLHNLSGRPSDRTDQLSRDIDAARQRLLRAAGYLLCRAGYRYGGNIRRDIVLLAASRAETAPLDEPEGEAVSHVLTCGRWRQHGLRTYNRGHDCTCGLSPSSPGQKEE